MADVNWWQVGGSLIGGGAFGAFLKYGFDLWRDRQQPVIYNVQLDKVFSETAGASALQAVVKVEYQGKSVGFSNLSLVRIDRV